MKLYREDGLIWFDSSSPSDRRPRPWPTRVDLLLFLLLGLLVGFRTGMDINLAAGADHAAAAAEVEVMSSAQFDAACCPRWRAPQQADLDALLAAGGSLMVYVDEDGACATLWHNGQPIQGFAGHPLDAARGCLERWIAEGGGR